MTIGQSIALHGRAIGDLLAELTPEELREIADYPWPEMFAWWDEKSYREHLPMFIRGEPLSHSMARFVWLQVMELDEIGVIELPREDEAV